MQSDPDIESAKQTIYGFAEAWSVWEKAMDAFDGVPFQDKGLRDQHAAILQKFCTPKRRVYVDCVPSFSSMLTYSDVTEGTLIHTEKINRNRIHLDFQGRWKFRRFVVVRTKEGWLLDSLKWKVPAAGPWKNGLIGG